MLKSFRLNHNPFPPAATGVVLAGDLWIPDSWHQKLETLFDLLARGRGVKALVIEGAYGTGKTYILQWLSKEIFEPKRVYHFFFDNPGLEFYDLANHLLRQIGRQELAKSIWEFVPEQYVVQRGMFDFTNWLHYIKINKRQGQAISSLAEYFQQEFTKDEEIASKLARLIVETAEKPYFEYRDFVAGLKGSIVAEGEEAPYFRTLINILMKTQNTEGVAFLIDEFEDVALQRRLSQRQAYDYLTTLRRLINVSEEENFWMVVSMTPEAVARTRELNKALWERFTASGDYLFSIPALSLDEARELILRRLRNARKDEDKADTSIHPFPEGLTDMLWESTVASPRRIVKLCFFVLAEAENENVAPPFAETLVKRVEGNLFGAQRKSGLP